MTLTTNAGDTYADQRRRETPTYIGLTAADVQARLRALARFVEYADNAVRGQDIERARDAARLALTELGTVVNALDRAMPAVQLSAAAAEARRVDRPWEPVQGVVDGPPVADSTWLDPVVVAAGDLAAMTYSWSQAGRPAPAAALRACAQLARQQPHRVTDLFRAAGRAHSEVRGALIRADALPEELR